MHSRRQTQAAHHLIRPFRVHEIAGVFPEEPEEAQRGLLANGRIRAFHDQQALYVLGGQRRDRPRRRR